MKSDNIKRELEIMDLWTQAQPVVWAFVRTGVRSHHDAQDIMQETAQQIVVKFDTYESDRPFIPWAVGIARNKISEYRRQKKREGNVLSEEALSVIAEQFGNHASAISPIQRGVADCMKKLDTNAQRLLHLRYTSNLKPRAISQRIGVSANTISIRLHRIRTALETCVRKLLLTEGVNL
jgi:RNA polymerase sigma-70 factor (ECF subfamily)